MSIWYNALRCNNFSPMLFIHTADRWPTNMTRATLLLCFTLFVLTHGEYKYSCFSVFNMLFCMAGFSCIFLIIFWFALSPSVHISAAPEPSKRGCCAPGPDCDNPCADQQEPAPEPQPDQAPPMAGYMPAPDAQQQFMPAPEGQQQFMPAPEGQQQFMPVPPEQQQMDQPMDQQQMDCCPPGPTCGNPCPPPPPPPPSFFVPPPPPPPAACCQPGPTCTNPCPMPPPMPDMGMAGCCDPSVMPTCQNPCQPPHPPRTAYAPYPGK